MKRTAILAIKVVISFCLLYWFFTLVEPQSVLLVYSRADIGMMGLAEVTMLVALFVSVIKWQRLLRCDGIDASLPVLTRFYLIGIYFNNFLPTSIGGDAMRVWLVANKYSNGTSGMASVLAERLTGLVALLFFAGALSLGGNLFPVQEALAWILLLLAPLILLMPFILGRARALRFVPASLRSKVDALFASLDNYVVDKRLLWCLGWTSAIYPFLVGLVYFWGGRAIGVDVGLLDLVVVTSLVTLLTLVPVSLNGLGIREGGFVFFLGLLGVPQAEALALSLLVFGLTLLFSLAGWVCFLVERD
jgi:hypothetical protein